MEFKYFSKNDALLPVEEALIPLSNIEYSYGFGVYETIRVTKTVPFFLADHIERLMESARIIGLEHEYTEEFVGKAIAELIEKNNVDTCNLKILLIGGRTPSDASLYILCLNPLFPDKQLYRDGVQCIIYEYERIFPHAKTLNMLGSYLAYRKATKEGAYDALLINHKGCITEGTRTNFFCIKGKTIISPPSAEILPGVTQKALKKAAVGFTFEEKDIALHEVPTYDGAFLTSTSSKVLPIRSIGSLSLPASSENLRELMRLFDDFLADSKGVLK